MENHSLHSLVLHQRSGLTMVYDEESSVFVDVARSIKFLDSLYSSISANGICRNHCVT